MMVSVSTIDAIHQVPIEDIIGSYIDLKKSGVTLSAICPFHTEKTPSFKVWKQRNRYRCFGCGVCGDAIEFVQEFEKIPFHDACRKIADMNGIQFATDEKDATSAAQYQAREQMFALLYSARETYKARIEQGIKSYLKSRNITEDSMEEWQLGYCEGWNLFTSRLKDEQINTAKTVGLIATSKNRDFDFFHDRLTIPINNICGQLIGFAGRILGEGKPKYLNSKESLLYSKQRVLFGFDKARANFKAHGMGALTEGYFDVIKLHQRGWNNAFATCGTSLTNEQAKLIKNHTDKLLILRDGDSAGRTATENDVRTLTQHGLVTYVCFLPNGEDPDTLFDAPFERIVNILWNWQDGVEYLIDQILFGKNEDTVELLDALEHISDILLVIDNEIKRDHYIKYIDKNYYKRGTPVIKKYLKGQVKLTENKRLKNNIPLWLDQSQLTEHGFMQLSEPTEAYRPGIYTMDGTNLQRITNFTIKPLFHINDQSNNRRLIEVCNGRRTAVVELLEDCLVIPSSFERELIKHGDFLTEIQFTKRDFKRIVGYITRDLPLAYELKTLGWQPEGFFAFSDAVNYKDTILRYDEYGAITIDEKIYVSLGVSKIQSDDRGHENYYENDLYLSYRPNKAIDFKQWAEAMYCSYRDHAMYGISFCLLTIMKDLVPKSCRMPHLYPHGPKGTGKSAFSESLACLFFSGINKSGEMLKAFNLGKNQGTPYAMANIMERFRNCPALMNEFDENNIEDFKKAMIKSAYDGEGREIGDGESGRRRKNRRQKINSSLLIYGQYLSTSDDGAILSRSICRAFKLSRMSGVTESEREGYAALKRAEQEGLSNVLIELLNLRPFFEKLLEKTFNQERANLSEQVRKMGVSVEERMLNNYSLSIAATKVLLEAGAELPYTLTEFFGDALRELIQHSNELRDNSVLQKFWSTFETLSDKGELNDGFDFRIIERDYIDLKVDGQVLKHRFSHSTRVLMTRYSNVYAAFSKHFRERTGREAVNEQTILGYLKDQPYYIGSTPREYFNDKRTSAFVFNYDLLEADEIVVLKYRREERLSQLNEGKNSHERQSPVSPILRPSR